MFKKNPKKYHYLITIFSAERNKMGTYSGVIRWTGSRYEAFEDRFEEACKQSGTDPKATYVWAWTFELDQLP